MGRNISTIVDGTKICSLCGDRKPLDEFHRAQATKQGYKGRCRDCRSAAPERASKEKRALSDKIANVKAKYGLTVAEYDAYLAKPCAICGGKSEVLDHCHSTGKPRAGLCGKCNSGIGMLGDDVERVTAAAFYLASHMDDVLLGKRWV